MTLPESPLPTGHPRSSRVQHRGRTAIIAGSALLLVILLISYIRYEVTHDLPNPSWGILGTSYSYTFEDGPPGVGLVETRPDEIVSHYIRDYIGVAGTFPCVATLANYDPSAADPFVRTGGETCVIHRPVAAVHIGITRIHTVWGDTFPLLPGAPVANVSYRIDYADGEHLDGQLLLVATPPDSQPYFRTRIHAKCWAFVYATNFDFYPRVVANAPRGYAYYDELEEKAICVGFR